VCELDKVNREIGVQKRGRTDLTNLYHTGTARVRGFSLQGRQNFSMSITDWLQHAGYGGSPEAWIVIERRNMKSQNGGWMDIEEGLERRR